MIAEDSGEDHEEEERQHEREEASLPVAEDREQVVARLVEDEHERPACGRRHDSLRVSWR